jgi:hypothetical protein
VQEDLGEEPGQVQVDLQLQEQVTIIQVLHQHILHPLGNKAVLGEQGMLEVTGREVAVAQALVTE